MSTGTGSTTKKVSSERWEALRREYRQRHTALAGRTSDEGVNANSGTRGVRSAASDDSSAS
jgi:hypothetical protein